MPAFCILICEKNMIFKPVYVFDKITDVTPEFLHNKQIKGVILDLDNTLTTHNNPTVPEKSLEWVNNCRKNNIKLIILSNNHAPRVEPFAEKLGVEFVCEGKKPLSLGYKKALEKLKLDKKSTAAIGDQIFTDTLGANLFGVKSIFVFPIEPETSLPFKLKRAIEKPLLPKRRS